MNALKIALVMTLAACGGSSKSANDTGTGPGPSTSTGEEGQVDPTIPSWAPKTCVDYQKAVTQASTCESMDQGARTSIEETYATDSAAWKAEQDATPERIAEVESDCSQKAASIKATTAEHCGPATETTP